MVNFYLVQLFGAIGVFSMPVLIVLVYYLFTYLGKKRQYHLAEVMVEKGQELPEGFFESNTMDSSVKLLKTGLVFLAVGVGAAIYGWMMPNNLFLSIASVPALVGIAYLIVAYVAHKKEDRMERLATGDKDAEA